MCEEVQMGLGHRNCDCESALKHRTLAVKPRAVPAKLGFPRIAA